MRVGGAAARTHLAPQYIEMIPIIFVEKDFHGFIEGRALKIECSHRFHSGMLKPVQKIHH